MFKTTSAYASFLCHSDSLEAVLCSHLLVHIHFQHVCVQLSVLDHLLICVVFESVARLCVLARGILARAVLMLMAVIFKDVILTTAQLAWTVGSTCANKNKV